MRKYHFALVFGGLQLLGGCLFSQEPDPPGAAAVLAELPNAPSPRLPGRATALPEAQIPTVPDLLAGRIPEGDSTSVVAVIPAQEAVTPEDCSLDTHHARQCRMHWHDLIIETSLFNAFEDAGNLYTGYWYRWETLHGHWFQRWINSAAGWRWTVWNDGNPVLDQYVGHSMMGAITNDLWIQNDPRSRTITQSDSWSYWRRLLQATAYSTAYSFWWKLGPTGEASVGHNGDHYFLDNSYNNGKVLTNETGWVELVTTPVGGALWTLGEDALDQHVVAPAEGHGRNPFAMLGLSFLEPAHATANIFRWRPPWYRDDRVAKARSFWSDPRGENEVGFGSAEAGSSGTAHEDEAFSSAVSAVNAIARSSTNRLPVYPYPGGEHEFGAWWGLSLISGHIWGYAGDVKYMPIDVRYTYLISPHRFWALRYAPELTALAMLDQPVPNPPNPPPPNDMGLRQRAYGSGISPAGFESDFLPAKRVQPFFSTDGGFLYFDQRVLSPQGSQFMYTIDFGTGIHIFRKARQDWTLGYRYQHLSNANISLHNPGTDANTFYLGVSRFRTKGYR